MLRNILVFVVFLIPGIASAQIFVSGGMGVPLSPDEVTDLFGNGYGLGAGFSLEHSSYPSIRLRPFGTYQKFQIDKDQLRREFEEPLEDTLGVNITASGGDMSVIFAGADLQIRVPYAAVSPYIAPLVGVVLTAIDDIKLEGLKGGGQVFDVQNEETAFAVGLGGGVLAELSARYELFVEAHYVYAFTSGNNFTWVPLRAGLVYRFE